jgi:ubiquinone/menaquinone biosynthesis C-methylase UbiE
VKKLAVQRPRHQENVNTYFHAQSSFWNDIYTNRGVYAEIHKDRHAAVLDWIDSLALPPESRVLEIGCGAGYLSVALARRGYYVQAIDSVEAMVDQARQHALESATIEQISLAVGDANALDFANDAFDLVLAIGVIPWLEQPGPAMREMARVAKPGGYVILTADNQLRLNNLLDPWLNPAFAPLKRRLKLAMERAGLRRRSPKNLGATTHSRHHIDGTLLDAELIKTRSRTLGFGPFSLLRRRILPEKLGTALHHRLQYLADQNVPGLRATGAHYIVLARKAVTLSPTRSESAEQDVSATADV